MSLTPATDRDTHGVRHRSFQRPSSSPLLILAKVLICLSVLAASCGVDRTLDADLLEAEIGAQLLPNFPGAIRSISCPNAAEPAPGQTLLCVATLGAQVLDVDVVIGGTEEALTTTATVDARFVAINEISALLAATFGDEIGLVTGVDCGQPILVLPADQSVACEATDPSGITRTFDVLIDDAGVLSLKLR